LNNAYAFGAFNVSKNPSKITLPLVDGTYENTVDGESITVKNGHFNSEDLPVIVKTSTKNKREIK